MTKTHTITSSSISSYLAPKVSNHSKSGSLRDRHILIILLVSIRTKGLSQVIQRTRSTPSSTFSITIMCSSPYP